MVRQSCFLLGLLCSGAAFANPPFAVDDASTVDAGKFRMDNYYKRQTGISANEYWLIPAYSPAKGMEISLAANLTDSDDGDANQLAAGFKWVGASVEDDSFGWGLSASMNRENPEDGDTTYSPTAGAIFSFALNEDLTLHTNAGFTADRENHRTAKYWGLQLEYGLTERWILIAETYGQSDEKPSMQAGFTYVLVADSVEIDLLYGEQHDGDERLHWGALGLRLYW